MELPHLGQHCSFEYCRKLDFLPIKCDGCKLVFCGDHFSYTGHNCPKALIKNVQVPVCPLCNAPVPGKIDELPDIRVSRHIDADCKSDTAQNRRQKVYTNRCTFKGCKGKEMIPILCDKCNLNFCLRHRHPQDHACTNTSDKSVGKAGQAALSRINQSSKNNHVKVQSGSSSFSSAVGGAASSVSNGFNRMMGFRPTSIQGNMSEDEALKMALQASLNTSGSTSPANMNNLSQEQADFLLAKAIAESEKEATTYPTGTHSESRRRSNQPNNCKIS